MRELQDYLAKTLDIAWYADCEMLRYSLQTPRSSHDTWHMPGAIFVCLCSDGMKVPIR